MHTIIFLSLHPTGNHLKEIGSEDENWTELSRTGSKQGEFTDTVMNLLPKELSGSKQMISTAHTIGSHRT